MRATMLWRTGIGQQNADEKWANAAIDAHVQATRLDAEAGAVEAEIEANAGHDAEGTAETKAQSSL